MAGLLSQTRRLNGLGGLAIAEPFAGGAGASLSLLYLEDTQNIYINDADPSIHDFWWTVVNRHRPFLEMLQETPVTIAEWRRQRDVYRSQAVTSRLHRGFAAFYLNRCNRSGIIMDGGPIGGVEQSGRWKLDARFNKSGLRARLEKIAEYRSRIHVSGLDGIELLEKLDPATTFFFIDPPYFEKGGLLYLNALNQAYHIRLAESLRRMSQVSWVLTYDDCPEVRQMYEPWATVRPFSLRYAAAERRHGKEVVITPKWMRLPATQESAAIVW